MVSRRSIGVRVVVGQEEEERCSKETEGRRRRSLVK